MGYVYLFFAIVAEIVGTSALKASHQFTKLVPSIMVFIGYGAAFCLLSLVLKTIPVGIAYAIWCGVGIVFITLIGIFFFKERLDIPAFIGIGLIIAGVLVINILSKVSAR
ncbi:MAG: multidrug efflux SMR transporter [Verrucomicrobiota bacterium]